jgi:hypothetical protein
MVRFFMALFWGQQVHSFISLYMYTDRYQKYSFIGMYIWDHVCQFFVQVLIVYSGPDRFKWLVLGAFIYWYSHFNLVRTGPQ